jgi:hypothetical protein
LEPKAQRPIRVDRYLAAHQRGELDKFADGRDEADEQATT